MNGYKIVLLKAIFMLYKLPESERVCSGICNVTNDLNQVFTLLAAPLREIMNVDAVRNSLK